MSAVCVYEDAARLEDLSSRFRSTIDRVRDLDEEFELERGPELAFVKRLFAAWSALKDEIHAASAHTLWKALSWFEAEVELAESELDCLEAELRTMAPAF